MGGDSFEKPPVDNPALPIEVRLKIMEAQLAHDLKQMEWKQQASEYERRQLEWRTDSWLDSAIGWLVGLAIFAPAVWVALR